MSDGGLDLNPYHVFVTKRNKWELGINQTAEEILASGLATLDGGTGDATWKTPLHPSMAA